MKLEKLDKKVKKVLEDYDKSKRIHLEKQATKMLKKGNKLQQLKNIVIDDDFLDLF